MTAAERFARLPTAAKLLLILTAVLLPIGAALAWIGNNGIRQANASLEATVAWRTFELELAKQRFEQALSRSNITVFTQDADLRYTWIHNPRLGLTEQDAFRWIQKTAMDLRLSMKQVADGVLEHGPGQGA